MSKDYLTLNGVLSVGGYYAKSTSSYFVLEDFDSHLTFEGSYESTQRVIWQLSNSIDLAAGSGSWGYREAWLGYEDDSLGSIRLGRGKSPFSLFIE